MIELRWVWHDFKDGSPPQGSICVGDRLYQKLQYRAIGPKQILGHDVMQTWGEWENVPHIGMPSNVQSDRRSATTDGEEG